MKLTYFTRPNTQNKKNTQTLWELKDAWVKPLYHKTNIVCSSETSFLEQVDKTKTFISGLITLPTFVIHYLNT